MLNVKYSTQYHEIINNVFKKQHFKFKNKNSEMRTTFIRSQNYNFYKVPNKTKVKIHVVLKQ